MRRPAACAILLLSLLPACGSKKSSNPSGDATLSLRAGAQVIFDARRTEWTENEVPGTEQISRPFVGDVAVDSYLAGSGTTTRWVVSYGVEARDYYQNTSCSGDALLVSEDGGATWSQHSLKNANLSLFVDTCAPPVQTSSGSTWVLLADRNESGFQEWWPAKVLSNDNLLISETKMLDCSPSAEGADFRCFSCVPVDDRAPHGPFHTRDYVLEVKSGTLMNRTIVSCDVGDTGLVETSAGVFVGFGHGCRLVTRWGQGTTKTCVDASAWPARAPQGDAFLTSRGAVAVGGGTDGHVYATDVPASGTVSVFDLGAGSYRRRSDFRQAYGNLVRIEDPGGAWHFVDLLADGTAQEVRLPATPCVSDAECGNGNTIELLRAAPLGGDRYLDIYLVDVAPPFIATSMYGNPGAHHFQLIASVDQATRPGVKPLGPGTEASPLEKACLRAVSCFSRPAPALLNDVSDCTNYWLVARTGTPANDADYQAFIATPVAGGCAAFDATWPLARAYSHSGLGHPYCVGSQIEASDVRVDFDCAGVGATCVAAGDNATCGPVGPQPSCNTCDTQGDAVACFNSLPTRIVSRCAALGKTCVTGATVWPRNFPAAVGAYCSAGTCDSQAPYACAGDVVIDCSPDGHIYSQSDCSRINLTCQQGVCRPDTSDCAPTFAASCGGTVASWCYNGSLRHADCTSLGMSQCLVSGGSVLCAP